ncbi:MAG: hypothetical protein ACR2KF_01440, partial [Nitrososphaeraceae archaeon]
MKKVYVNPEYSYASVTVFPPFALPPSCLTKFPGRFSKFLASKIVRSSLFDTENIEDVLPYRY